MGRMDHPWERFLAKIEFTDSCWLWHGAIRENGYGVFSPKHGVTVRAHRYSFMLFCGALRPGMDVCHRCDVRACVRPDHLFQGTRLENIRDAVAKGRIAHGDAHYNAKLSANDAIAIRLARAMGVRVAFLAAMYSVDRDTIYKVTNHKTWGSVS